jgi:hypothetical protein
MVSVSEHAPADLCVADDVTNTWHAYDCAETARDFQDRES